MGQLWNFLIFTKEKSSVDIQDQHLENIFLNFANFCLNKKHKNCFFPNGIRDHSNSSIPHPQEHLQVELNSIKTNLTETENRLLDSLEGSDRSLTAYKSQMLQQDESIKELTGQLAMWDLKNADFFEEVWIKEDSLYCRENQEKLTILMKNAEISQKEEILRQELRQERDEAQELHERVGLLQRELDKR